MVIPVSIINTMGMSSTGALGVSFHWMPCLVDRCIPLLPLGKRQKSASTALLLPPGNYDELPSLWSVRLFLNCQGDWRYTCNMRISASTRCQEESGSK